MKILVNSQRLQATIKCFVASGNRFALAAIQRKGLRRCRSPLLEGLSLMCADRFAVGVDAPPKSFSQAFVACHEIVKGENDEDGKMFLFFPAPSGIVPTPLGDAGQRIAIFSRTIRQIGNECRRAPLCRRMVTAHSMHCPAERRD